MLLGDTVNTAARMEATGIPGYVQISEASKNRLSNTYQLEKRGSIEIKGKGHMTTWLLK